MTRFDFPVTGMSCSSCSANVEQALKSLPNVSDATVNLATGQATVLSESGSISLQTVVDTVRNSGYGVETETEHFTVEGMSCASCSANVERALSEAQGVLSATANLASNSADVIYVPGITDQNQLAEIISSRGYSLVIDHEGASVKSPVEIHKLEFIDNRNKFLIAAAGAILVMTLSMTKILDVTYSRLVMAGITSAVLALAGRSIYIQAIKRLRHFSANMNTLIAIGTGSAFLYSIVATVFPSAISSLSDYPPVYYDTATLILAFIILGRMLEARAKSRASDAITGLLKMTPETATVIRDNRDVPVPTADLLVGDLIRVRSGDRIPTDGVIVEGGSAVDESMMTGEPIPVEKSIDDSVFGGTINGTGSFVIRATKVGADTALANIIRLVEQAQGSKAPIQRLADKVAGVFVPIVIGIAIITMIIWLIFGPEPALSLSITAFVAVLIVACPCAMGLATPTAIMVCSGTAARKGVVFRGGEIIEATAKLDTIMLDKTGTITEGKPAVVEIITYNTDESRLLVNAASVESGSDHPLADALKTAVQHRGLELVTVKDFETSPGRGVSGRIGERTILVGSASWLAAESVKMDSKAMSDLDALMSGGITVLGVVIDGELEGWIGAADRIRSSSTGAIEKLHDLGLNIVMVTGDTKLSAQKIAMGVGIDEVVAQVMPDEKVGLVMKSQENGKIVGMVGDGINDAPALARADVGFAIGTGSDIALEASDITLMGSELTGVSFAIGLARKTVRIIKQNLFWAFFYNMIAIPVAAGLLYPITGTMLSPTIAAAAMALSSVSVVTNSLRLRKFR